MRVPTVPVVCVVFLASRGLAAQPAAFWALHAGERVRITGPAVAGPAVNGEGTRVAHFLGAHGDTLYLRGAGGAEARGDSTTVTAASLTRLEVSAGTTRHTRLGAVLGTLAGGLIGGLTAGDPPNVQTTRESVVLESALSGAVLGALGGRVAGHFWKSERWDALPPPRAASSERRVPWRLAVVGRGLAAEMRF